MPLPKFISDFARLIFPNNCAGCGEELFGSKNLLCWQCLKELPRTGFEKHENNPVAAIFYGRIPLQHAFSWLFYTKGSLAQMLIQQVKYRSNLDLGKYLGTIMAEAMLDANLYNDVDALVPLPLNRKKLAKRGYNQSMLICEGMSGVLGKPVETVAVIRSRFTETQTRKNRLQRWMNVEQVFDLKEAHNIERKHVLLVDDVITTGATMEACGHVLLQVPGLKLSLASLAMASKL
jgi:ComF family protein